MTITGTVENIIFRNDENMYTVLELETADIPVVATGIFPSVIEGETIELYGEFKDSKYGEQFVAEGFKSIGFQDVKAITRFLAGGLFKGVGEITARAITDKFGLSTFDVIEKTPDELTKIRGISAKKAADITNSYKDVVLLREAIIYLTEKGLSFNLALKIFNVYKNRTISTVNKNPYLLVEDVDGVGFKTADDVAKKLGVDVESDFRVRAGLIYALKQNGENLGSTCIPVSMLVETGCTLLGFSKEVGDQKFVKILKDLEIEGKVKHIFKDDCDMVALSVAYYTERALAVLMKNISRHANSIYTDVDFAISEFEKIEGFKLADKQKEAVKTCLEGGITVITGGPGTGKTTIVKCILHLLEKEGKKIALVAPTGRAAKRLEETTGRQASTIHRLLDLDYKNGKGQFTYNETTKLEHDVLIVDEVSMTDVYVMKSLLSAVKLGGRVIFVGDKDQLPSVGEGNVLSDVLESGLFPTAILDKVYRQGKESLIITNAHRINNGEMPDLSSKDSDFFWSPVNVADAQQKRIVEMATTTLPKFLGIEKEDVQILTPMKKGALGTIALNSLLQEHLNAQNGKKAELTVGKTLFRVGDRVMQTVNDYHTEWTKLEDGRLRFGEGVFNGDIGKIEFIDPDTKEMTVLMEDGRNVSYDRTNSSELMLSYAITVHKSQGSEFDACIIPVGGGSPQLFTRNLLYTAITRAKRLVVLIGHKVAIKRMVDNNYIEKRYTMLKNFLLGQDL
ncbi:MAG: ATP-dependent RecD-like DNA helicase [Clostridia bacterium]|nr:ATP-dependent RecD-like DNA helicase [Clostridia bacterium]